MDTTAYTNGTVLFLIISCGQRETGLGSPSSRRRADRGWAELFARPEHFGAVLYAVGLRRWKPEPYLLHGMEITRPNQVWAMDITYIPMARGFVYLAVVLDWFSRRVLSWRVSITMEAAFCVDTLEEVYLISEPTAAWKTVIEAPSNRAA
jgi:transposase InsO family protein